MKFLIFDLAIEFTKVANCSFTQDASLSALWQDMRERVQTIFYCIRLPIASYFFLGRRGTTTTM
jgi:hypothetical protein